VDAYRYRDDDRDSPDGDDRQPGPLPTPQARIRAICPDCGEVDLAPAQVELRLGRLGWRGSYRFTCPSCLLLVTKPADRRVVRLLASAGVAARLPGGPAPAGAGRARPPAEALEPHHGPPLTWDDLLDLHVELQAPDWWARFLAAHG
jgi:hypothetical protein